MERSHGREFQAMSGAPVKKLPASPSVGLPGIPVPDRGSEEVDIVRKPQGRAPKQFALNRPA